MIETVNKVIATDMKFVAMDAFIYFDDHSQICPIMARDRRTPKRTLCQGWYSSASQFKRERGARKTFKGQ